MKFNENFHPKIQNFSFLFFSFKKGINLENIVCKFQRPTAIGSASNSVISNVIS